MRELYEKEIRKAICNACSSMAYVYPKDIYNNLEKAYEDETNIRGKNALEVLLQNANIAQNEQYPICQDTGMVVAFVTIGQDVHINGSLKNAINGGVKDGYEKGYLRKSVVNDPVFDRQNTTDNTPAIIYYSIVEGDIFTIDLASKGFGSENMSRIQMLKPAQGVRGVKDFVLETVKLAGPNACPPFVLGIGIGGTFDYAAHMAKHALTRDTNQANEDIRYATLEKELLEEINNLGMGPLGLGGKTTCLAVNIETYPTHIAGMPCAVNINCHVTRHSKVVL